MTPERFDALAEAYGGDVARWPEGEREAAAMFMATDPARAQAVLAAAQALDQRLDAWAALRVTPDFADAVLAGAPKPRAGSWWRGWLAPAGMGAGLAAACVAGLLVGTRMAVAPLATDPDVEALVTAVGEDAFDLYLDDEAAG
jgi:hypothetical protein